MVSAHEIGYEMYRLNSVCCHGKTVKIQIIRNTHAPTSDTSIGGID